MWKAECSLHAAICGWNLTWVRFCAGYPLNSILLMCWMLFQHTHTNRWLKLAIKGLIMFWSHPTKQESTTSTEPLWTWKRPSLINLKIFCLKSMEVSEKSKYSTHNTCVRLWIMSCCPLLGLLTASLAPVIVDENIVDDRRLSNKWNWSSHNEIITLRTQNLIYFV